MKRLILLTLCVAFSLGTQSCKRQERESSTTKTTIAVIPKGTVTEFWRSIHAGAVKASRELNVDVVWKGPLKEDDREAQISIVEDFITRKVSGIILAPLDDAALSSPVATAHAAGIPVIIIDSDLKSEEYVSFIATDNYLGGQLAGRRMVEILKGRGSVIMLRFNEGSASTAKREQGFLDAIAQAPGITVLNSSQYGGVTTESAYKASENLLAPYRGGTGKLSVDGIFTCNESTTFGMLRALQDGGFAGSVPFIGFDSSPKLVEALGRGEISGLVLQNPFKMGYEGVITMVSHLSGKPVERKIDTGVTLATRENMNQPEVHDLLQPDLSRWLQ